MLKSRNQCGKKTIYLILMVKSYKFAAGISLAMLVTVLCLVGCEPATDKSSQDQAGDSGRPNVVLIITDDQGYGDLGVHGNPIISTPNMDALAEESIRLEDYHVAPTCAPTRAGLLTGRWHNRTGVWHTVMGRSMLRQDEVTLADMLAANGYRTAMIGKWHLGDNYPYRPHDRGFEYAYYNGGGGVGQTPDFWNNAYFDGSYFRNGQAEPAEGYVTDVFFDEAIAFIDSVRGGDKPFFVYLATNAPHGPMHAPPQYADLYADEGLSVAVQHFLGMISNIDDNVGKLRDYLDDNGLSENTVFIFTTDNGTSSGNNIFNAGMRGKKGSEYEGGHRVPFFLHWPAGGLSAMHRVDRVTAHVDIVPTLLDLTRSTPPDDVDFDGRSLRPLLEGAAIDWPDRVLISDSQRVLDPIKWRRSYVMTDQWRLINGEDLYDIDKDPGQEEDVAGEYPQVRERLRAEYEAQWAELLPTFAEPTPVVLGHASANPAVLTGHDWLGTNAQVPWNQRHIRILEREADGVHKGYWWVDFAEAGTYEFELRRWPAEAGLPIIAAAMPGPDVPGVTAFRAVAGKPFAAISAQLRVGELSMDTPVAATDTQVSFIARLDVGKTRLAATFTDKDGVQVGAYYVTARRLAE
jgi:arylsulfatase B